MEMINSKPRKILPSRFRIVRRSPMWITGVLLLVLLDNAYAQIKFGETVFVIGSGNVSCGKWLEERENRTLRAQRMQWLLGWVSAYNWSNVSRQVQLQDGQSALAFVDRYCTNNPLQPVLGGAEALIEELGGPKVPYPWKR